MGGVEENMVGSRSNSLGDNSPWIQKICSFAVSIDLVRLVEPGIPHSFFS